MKLIRGSVCEIERVRLGKCVWVFGKTVPVCLGGVWLEKGCAMILEKVMSSRGVHRRSITRPGWLKPWGDLVITGGVCSLIECNWKLKSYRFAHKSFLSVHLKGSGIGPYKSKKPVLFKWPKETTNSRICRRVGVSIPTNAGT